MGYFLLLTLIIAGLLSSSCQELKMPKGKHCKHVPGADLDENWFDSVSAWEAVDGSKMEPEMGPPTPIPNESNLKHKKCHSYTINVPLGTYSALNECKYDKLSEQYCHLKSEGSPIDQFFRFQGSFFFTKTDNESYIVAYGCGNMVNQFWTLYLAEGKEIDDEDIKKEILHHAHESLGFEIHDTDRRSDDDSISPEGLKKSECSGMPFSIQDSKPTIRKLGKSKSKNPALDDVTKLLTNPLAAFKAG